jgi:hypothetical protein
MGSMQAAGLTLPGGVMYSWNYDDYNIIVDTTIAPLTKGLPSQITGHYSSHEDFSNLPEGTIVYARSVTTNAPTLVEYKYGSGWVILTSNPLEWGYKRLDTYTVGLLYPRIIRYVLGMPITDTLSGQSLQKKLSVSDLNKIKKDILPTSGRQK